MARNEHRCPVCNNTEFPFRNSYYTCENCGWMDDAYQEDYPDEDGCANIMSLNEAREAYKNGKKVE